MGQRHIYYLACQKIHINQFFESCKITSFDKLPKNWCNSIPPRFSIQTFSEHCHIKGIKTVQFNLMLAFGIDTVPLQSSFSSMQFNLVGLKFQNNYLYVQTEEKTDTQGSIGHRDSEIRSHPKTEEKDTNNNESAEIKRGSQGNLQTYRVRTRRPGKLTDRQS